MKRHVKVSQYDYFNAAQLKQFALRHTHIIECLGRMTARIVCEREANTVQLS